MTHANDWSAGEPDTVLAVLQRSTARFGDKVFLDFLGTEYAFAQLDAESSRLAHGLIALGVQPGDTVASLLDNSADAVLTWLAINKAGAISVPLNTAYKGAFLCHPLCTVGAQIVIAESDYAERLVSISGQLPQVRTVVYRGEAPALAGTHFTGLPFEQLKTAQTTAPDVAVRPEDIALVIFTGGTTGASKGCTISHNFVCSLGRQAVYLNGKTEASINWTPLPLFHLNAVAASVVAQMLVGGKVCIYPRFSVSNFWPEMERTGANDVNLLGSLIPLLATAPDNDAMKRCFGQLKMVSGAPFPPEMQKVWKERFGAGVCGTPGYGMTEATMITSLPFGAYAKPGSAGKRNQWFDVRLVDDHDVEVPVGTPGEIIIRPLQPHIMFEGYWGQPEATLQAMKNLWFHTGDIGKFDEEGFFYFVDRKKDCLRRGGENISSFEMESTLRQHSAIEDVAVHAVPSELSEDEVKVVAVLKAGASVSEQQLCEWLIDRVPYYAVPRYIELRTELPRNPVGRVLKYELRDQGVTPATWDRVKAGVTFAKR